MTAPIFVVIPMVNYRDMAVPVTVMVVISLADVHRYAFVLRHNHCLIGAVRSREGRYCEKSNRSNRQGNSLHGPSSWVVGTPETICGVFGSAATQSMCI
jgi:hypothetical protein